MIGTLVQQTFRAMGTSCAIAITTRSVSEPRVRRALAAGRDEVAACEQALSRFDPRSDLSRLNGGGGSWIEVDRRLLEALSAALRAREITDGKFDPTILPALVAAGYDRTFDELEERVGRRTDGWRAGAEVEVDADAGCARVEPGAAVDLGGIGKGFSAARALAAMQSIWPGLPGGLVDLGGDIALTGATPDGGLWRVAIADPRSPETILTTLAVESGGVATSGRDRRRFGPGRTLHHLIDPVTGRPALAGPLTVTVVAPDAADAESHATALAVSSLPEARAHLSHFPQLAALYVPQDGTPFTIGDLPLQADVAAGDVAA